MEDRCREYAEAHLGDELREIEKVPGIKEAHPELSIHEKALIYKYSKDITQVEAVNEALRSGESPEFAELLSDVLRKLPSYQGLVYRGADLFRKELARYQEGMIIEEPSFTSSSRQRNIAYQFCGNSFFRILSWKNGRLIERLSKYGSNTTQNEKEVLFLPGTAFQVKEVTKQKDLTLITLEEVSE